MFGSALQLYSDKLSMLSQVNIHAISHLDSLYSRTPTDLDIGAVGIRVILPKATVYEGCEYALSVL